MATLPLLTHKTLDSTLAYREGEAISVGRFLSDVQQVAARMLPGRHVVNLCANRYRFSVVFAAAVTTGRVSLLPSTHTPEMLRQMQAMAPDVFCVRDQDDDDGILPCLRYPENLATADCPVAIPEIDVDQEIAQVFTSGSTGLPIPHIKRWGSLVKNVQAEIARLGVSEGYAIVATVPAQHMYGLESSVLMPMLAGAALHAGRPFYPADIIAALEALPRPRMLVTTPYHLRTLLATSTPVPPAELLLSATAPLSGNLAQAAESAFHAPLYEIYGCTETGQLATRQTSAGPEWSVLPGIQLRESPEGTWAEGGHIDAPTLLGDVIEQVTPGRFLLHGRNGDLVNIAGKRTSLAYLNHQLNAIAGVEDGVFLLPKDATADESVQRLSALVVAPGHNPASLLQALRERIDPIFLPRPLLFVDALPRNATGKLPSQQAQELMESLLQQPADQSPSRVPA